MMRNLEVIWDNLLSRDEKLVRVTFEKLSEQEQAVILDHLKRMAEETGWHAEQRISAGYALKALTG